MSQHKLPFLILIFLSLLLFSCKHNKDATESSSFSVNIAECENGSVETSKKKGLKPGSEIKLKVHADLGYELDYLKVTDINGKEVSLNVIKEGLEYSFVMPASRVSVKSGFKKKVYRLSLLAYEMAEDSGGSGEQSGSGEQGGSGDNSDSNFVPSDNAEIIPDKSEDINFGDSISLTIKCDEGYIFDSVKIKDSAGNSLSYNIKDSVITFTMPASDVSIKVLIIKLFSVNFELGGGYFYYKNASEEIKGNSLVVEKIADGSCAEPPYILIKNKKTTINDFAKDGANFICWCEDEEATKLYDFSKPVTKDTTIYALWAEPFQTRPVKIPSGFSGSNGDEDLYMAFGDWPRSIKKADVTVDEASSVQKGFLTLYMGDDQNYYVKNDDIYYKLESIIWRVLTDNYKGSGKALLLSEEILYSGIPFYGARANSRSLDGKEIYSNDYKYSNIRAFLNGKENAFVSEGGLADDNCLDWSDEGFLQSAFSSGAQNFIEETMIDSFYDKIFLLSLEEVTEGAYSFGSGQENCENRIKYVSDYSKACGASCNYSGIYYYAAPWWLRSAYKDDNSTFRVCIVSSKYGTTWHMDYETCASTDVGVVPALCINID